MARFARVVLPGVPHHVTQRGNRRQRTFFSPADYRAYLALLAEWAPRCGVRVWAYCLMPNHVHLIVVPEREDSLARGIGEVHRRYSRRINLRNGWRGFLFQGRFASVPMDEHHLWRGLRYVLLNPVRPGMVKQADQWAWSSARALTTGAVDPCIDPGAPAKPPAFWREFLRQPLDPGDLDSLRRHTRTGRPLGSEPFLDHAEEIAGRTLRPQRRGRRPRTAASRARPASRPQGRSRRGSRSSDPPGARQRPS